jgi:hypothetical protein
MGYLRDEHGSSTTFSPFQQHHVPRSAVVQQPPMQNQYQFVSKQYAPPTQTVSAGQHHHYTTDAQNTSLYTSTSTQESLNSLPFQSHANPHHQGNELYYYPRPISSDTVVSAEHPQSFQNPHSVPNISQRYHSRSTNPSPFTPASEISVNFPSTAHHSSSSPASWSEETSVHPSQNTARQVPYRPIGPGKRDRNARKAEPAGSIVKIKSRKRQRRGDLPGESGDSDSDDESDAPTPVTHNIHAGMPTRL